MRSSLQFGGDAAHSVKCGLAAETLRSSGHLRLQVNGWSMFPALRPGDKLSIECAEKDTVAEEDIVLFARNGRLFVHRVVKKDPGTAALVTRGDSMCRPDPDSASCELLGKVVRVQRSGRCFELARRLPLPSRAIAVLMRHSETASRVIVGMHGILHGSGRISLDRVTPCQT